MRLLLISNSTQHGSGYLDHCASEIREFLGDARRVLFVPFALADQDGYAEAARGRFAKMGFDLDSLHDAEDPVRAVRGAQAMFIGGGNTFRLLDSLYRMDVLGPIRERVGAGMPYIGSSAGSNMACPTIKTTNDMPIVQPPQFEALGLVPFQLNCHYLDADPSSTHQGETRELRLREFHEENGSPVLALREGALLRVDGREIRLLGSTGARLFVRGAEARECSTGERLDALLS